MMRSLFSGVSGLKTHQTRMDVIGNNIANVNTTAYKASSMTFAALMSQTTQKASGANATTGTGGVNPRQIGLGVKGAAINVNITGQGSSQSTGNPFDLMITGSNFFVVSDGSTNYFTRDGSFYVDGSGNLAMTSVGYTVMGWQVDETTGNIKKDTVSALRIMSTANMTYPPEATSEAYMGGIIDEHDTDVTSANGKTVNLSFYDALGYDYTAKFIIRQSDDDKIYSLELDKILDSTGAEVDLSRVDGGTEALFGAAQTLEKKGTLTFLTGYSWNGTKLMNGNDEVADLAQLIDTTKTPPVFKTGEYEDASVTPPVTKKVEDELDKIAKAYGYEGNVKEFFAQVYTQTAAAGGTDMKCTVEQMLLAQGGATITALEGGNAPAIGTVLGDGQAGNPPSKVETTGRRFEGVTIHFNPKTGVFAGIGGAEGNNSVTLNLRAIGRGNFSDIKIDLSELGNFDNKGTSTAAATSGSNEDGRVGYGSGRRLGDMVGIAIQQDGKIFASYDNGMTRLLGQIATARFANASGLEKAADNLYSATLNSGEFDGIGVDITADGSYMSTGQLEMSNVDLSSEFTEMITTQRGFQANSRIITVSDTLLEELTNLKR